MDKKGPLLYVECKNCGNGMPVPFSSNQDMEVFVKTLLTGKGNLANRLFPIECPSSECSRTYFYGARDMFIPSKEEIGLVIERLMEATGAKSIAELFGMTPEEMDRRITDK